MSRGGGIRRSPAAHSHPEFRAGRTVEVWFVSCDMSTRPDYRIPASSVSGMDDGHLFWAVIEKAWPDVQEPDLSKKLMHATPGQKAILAITIFIRELDNGGFEQFFWNESGDIANEVIAGFLRLGSPEHAEVVRRATRFFGSISSTPKQAARREYLSQATMADKESYFEPLSETLYGEPRLWPLFRRYLDQHPEEFFIDGPS